MQASRKAWTLSNACSLPWNNAKLCMMKVRASSIMLSIACVTLNHRMAKALWSLSLSLPASTLGLWAQANIKVQGNNGRNQMLKIWLPGLLQLVGDHAKAEVIADAHISSLLDMQSGLRLLPNEDWKQHQGHFLWMVTDVDEYQKVLFGTLPLFSWCE